MQCDPYDRYIMKQIVQQGEVNSSNQSPWHYSDDHRKSWMVKKSPKNHRAQKNRDKSITQHKNRENREIEMASGMMIKDAKSFPRRFSGRPIPKRGQVKVAIVLGLANSVSAIFSRTASCVVPPHFTH
ncbi:hypothetical protein V8G54_033976 [Vigna mungo]|uniref:Uncharacterized protein n=1 Tax=Vigna mungo TaxID=3915 RepID=A0AAQ3RJI4_VIGMU